MAFDKPTRNRLAAFVAAARRLITDEFTQQFQSLYGISDKGTVTPLDQLGHLDDAGLAVASLLRERIDYLVKTHPDDREGIKAAVARLAREQAFTILNRLAAIRMAEKRGLIAESVGKGYQSKGFKVFETVAGSALGDTYHRYRRYLFCLFDELAVDLGILFDRHSPQALIFPQEPALLALLDLLHAVDLEPLWAEDETIGWIYQYYNDPDERKKMRKESAAPRNSRELAVRNQFFTPRYVVEFLTDNTLGRIWYEMTKGKTRLVDQCRYLVRRPTEIFLAAGEAASEISEQEGLSQEEILKQPVHIPHRPLKDPREIRLLDPACGSMHFGLYAFDLFETIYEEAWDNGFCPVLQEEYASRDEFLKEVPRLIIEHNIHGIDIDPRAVQIAGLSLWLRAQKAWQAQYVNPADRPRVRRSNIVCAEPMPGSPEMLEGFIKTLDQPLLGELVKTVFDKMQLAGEAGSLLKIEEEIRTAIDTARKAWEKIESMPRQLSLSEELSQASKVPELTGLEKVLTTGRHSLTTDFWDTAEQQVINALRDYAEQADADSYQRRLFADDAARGFAFIDLCRKRYDAVVMNPPFGAPVSDTVEVITTSLTSGRNDIYSSFIARAIEILAPGGQVGSITSRTFLVLSSFSTLRARLIHDLRTFRLCADLGLDVMDDAGVYAAACVYGGDDGVSCSQIDFFDCRNALNKSEKLLAQVGTGETEGRISLPHQAFTHIPNFSMPYWAGPELFDCFNLYSAFEPQSGIVRQGLSTGDDDRWIRLWWEVDSKSKSRDGEFVDFEKGGDYSPFYHDCSLVIHWNQDGRALKSFAQSKYGSVGKVIYGTGHFFDAGLTFSRLTVKGFHVRVLPRDHIFSSAGMYVGVADSVDVWFLLAYLNSQLSRALLGMLTDGRKWEIGYVQRIPVPEFPPDLAQRMASLGRKLFDGVRQVVGNQEVDRGFIGSICNTDTFHMRGLEDEINAICEKQVGFSKPIKKLEGESSINLWSADVDQSDAEKSASRLSYLVGTAFGRWDIRYATGERQPPELPDPFDPLPVCPPGMLQNAEGLPAEPMDVPADYPLHISWPGILVDDENHPEDIVTRVREAIEVIWKDRAEAIEQEVCEILGVKTLRDYFRRPAAFFADHLKRYSKSRRQAPIYWPLSTRSGSYTLWLYYHRLTEQTLHTALADFVDPKLKAIRAEISTLRESATHGNRLEELLDLEHELADFRAEIERIIKLPWKPDLNDGVLITASPLAKLFRLPKWQKDLKACWEKLATGEYDWAHLAYSIWPQRVEEACKKDRSIAIAHNLEHLCLVEPSKPKKKGQKKNISIDFGEGE